MDACCRLEQLKLTGGDQKVNEPPPPLKKMQDCALGGENYINYKIIVSIKYFFTQMIFDWFITQINVF